MGTTARTGDRGAGRGRSASPRRRSARPRPRVATAARRVPRPAAADRVGAGRQPVVPARADARRAGARRPAPGGRPGRGRGVDAGPRPRSRSRPARSDGRVLVGTDDGRRSTRLGRRHGAAAVARWSRRSTDVVRRATLEPGRHGRSTRSASTRPTGADLGVWRRVAGRSEADRVLPPLGAGRGVRTDLADRARLERPTAVGSSSVLRRGRLPRPRSSTRTTGRSGRSPTRGSARSSGSSVTPSSSAAPAAGCPARSLRVDLATGARTILDRRRRVRPTWPTTRRADRSSSSRSARRPRASGRSTSTAAAVDRSVAGRPAPAPRPARCRELGVELPPGWIAARSDPAGPLARRPRRSPRLRRLEEVDRDPHSTSSRRRLVALAAAVLVARRRGRPSRAHGPDPVFSGACRPSTRR